MLLMGHMLYMGLIMYFEWEESVLWNLLCQVGVKKEATYTELGTNPRKWLLRLVQLWIILKTESWEGTLTRKCNDQCYQWDKLTHANLHCDKYITERIYLLEICHILSKEVLNY